jgi:DNA-binding transcriptional MerR regulator/methylmalonyl-CoA mutase cobalamin-binding subunit
MATTRTAPRFNLKAVVQQTGLKPDTLRAWERRYGLPLPERSSGGHRLYSEGDVETIKWLMARQREGLSIKRAVELWRQIEVEGRDPAQSATPVATQLARVSNPAPLNSTVANLRAEWIDACTSYDEQRTEQLVNQAFALYPPEVVATELLQKAVVEIGQSWYQGGVTVQQEHFCTALIIRRLEALIMAAPPPTRPGRILLACAPQEQHIIGPLLLTFLLRRRGWQVIYLGSNVPADQLESTIEITQPELVILSAQLLHTAATLLEASRLVQQAGVPLAYGGLVFNMLPKLRERIPGHFLGERLEAAPHVIETLMATASPAPEAEAIPVSCLEARDHFQERQGLIEAAVVQKLGANGYTHNHVALANRELGLSVSAALALGDMEYLGTDIAWVAGLIQNYQLPPEALPAYLQTYQEAAREQLGKAGRPVTDWLDRLLSRQPAQPGAEV